MRQFSTYGAKLTAESTKPIQAMVRIYRETVTYLIRVCMEQWEEITQKQTLQGRQSYVERLIHHTKNRVVVSYEDFDALFYKLPSYLRRAAISEALGQVDSYKSNLNKWIHEGNGRAPGKPEAG